MAVRTYCEELLCVYLISILSVKLKPTDHIPDFKM